MNKRGILYAMLFLWALLLQARQDDYLFDEELLSEYDRAYDLNEAKDYLGAYRCIVAAEKRMDATLSRLGRSAASLSDDEFRHPYWPLKKSKAEIAYMLGNYAEMAVVSRELKASLDAKQWGSTEASEAVVRGMKADWEKIEGSRYYLLERYDSCEVALKEALSLGRFEGNEAFLSKVYGDLAQLYYKQEAYAQALASLDSILASPAYQADARRTESLQEIRLVQSQRALCLARLGRYDEALSTLEPACTYFKQSDAPRLYAEALRKKAKILMLQYDRTDRYNAKAVDCYKEYLSISRNYIDRDFVRLSESEREQYWMAELPFVTDCFRLEGKAPDLLYDVALYSKAVLLQMGRDFKEGMTEEQRKAALASIRVTWKQVREQLPADGCAIEFVTYEKRGQNHLGAVIVRKDSSLPQFVDLGEVASLSDYRLSNRLTVKEVFADTQDRDKINTLYNDTLLPTRIWTEEVVKAIGSSRRIYFSPDGLLHQMGIEYLLPAALKGRSLYRLTTTRLLTQGKRSLHTDSLLLCGGVEYGWSQEDPETGNDELAYSLLASMHLNVAPLPNSSVEIDSIAAVRGYRKADGMLRADSLTETTLNQLMGKYHIVHLSTHGLFSEVAQIGTDIRPSSTDTQLSKSCLFLSGSGKSLKQDAFDPSRHDGILSARELAKMNLEKVDLTVLSACMSGLGYITPDGVYGLQRGLKTAGVRTIISTLWSVDDEASCYFIIRLYENLESGKELHEAFEAARESLKKYEKSYGNASSDAGGSFTQRRRFTIPKYNKPYFYNAFILIDGI